MGKYSFTHCLLILWLLFLGVTSCQKDIRSFGEDPYAGGQKPLGISFDRINRPLAAQAPGDIFEVSVRGLAIHRDQVEVFINEQASEIISVTDSTMEVRVPDQVASGGLKVKVGNQLFLGPRVPIEGNVRIDRDFGVVLGYNGAVRDIVSSGTDFWVVGDFYNFDNEASDLSFRNNIHLLSSQGKTPRNSNGSMDTTVNRTKLGALGGINSMVKLANGQFVVGGSFYSFNNHRVSAIARLGVTGALDTMVVDVVNTTPQHPANGKDTVTALNAFFDGPIVGMFPTPDNGVIVLGNFDYHNFINYDYSSRESIARVWSNVKHIARIKYDGKLDSTFSYGNSGANGIIHSAIRTNSGKIVAVGSFTTFNGETANRIISFNSDGSIDRNFNVGSGANNEIIDISYNSTRDVIAVAGKFTSFNGIPKSNVVLLNSDGTVVSSFTLGEIDSRSANYAYVLNSGQVLVSGDFKKYNGISRSRILILESDGSALQKFNNMGSFDGVIWTVKETTSSLGRPALLIGGDFSMADDVNIRGLFKLEIKKD